MTALVPSLAFAAGTGLSTQGVGGAHATVHGCDTNADTNWNLAFTKDSSGNVTGVTVSNIASTCNGQTLLLTLANASGADLGHGTATITSGAASVSTLSGHPAGNTVVAVYGAVAGP